MKTVLMLLTFTSLLAVAPCSHSIIDGRAVVNKHVGLIK